jgi:hypothetical protein
MSAAVTFRAPVTVQCGYCTEDAELVDKREVYQQGFDGKVWLCRPCRAWVPAHKEFPHRPKGTLAKSLLRAKRLKAYCLFEQVWRGVAARKGWDEDRARSAGYHWLASEMGISATACNISAFDEVRTQIVIDICSAVVEKKDVAA